MKQKELYVNARRKGVFLRQSPEGGALKYRDGLRKT